MQHPNHNDNNRRNNRGGVIIIPLVILLLIPVLFHRTPTRGRGIPLDSLWVVLIALAIAGSIVGAAAWLTRRRNGPR